MVHLLRRFQKPLLIVVVTLVIISYVVFYNLQATHGLPQNAREASIYGRGVTSVQLQKTAMQFDVCLRLQMGDLLFGLGGRDAGIAAMMGQGPDEAAVQNYIWNTMVLRHEAQALGIDATDAEVASAIKGMQIFQTNGVYDYAKYTTIMDRLLSPRGLTQKDLEELVGDQVRLDKVRALVGTTVHPAASAVHEQYVEQNQKLEASFFRLKMEDFKAAVKVTDEDVAKLYGERQASLKTPEKRKVKFVGFTLAGETKPLVGKERAQASQKLAERAQDFAIALTEKGATIDSVAAQQGLKVGETPAFAQEEPPSELSRSEAAAEAAFRLTPAQPASDVVGAENGYFVLQLSGTEPSRPLTLEEAKEQLTAQILQERAQEGLNLKAAELRTKIETALKAGQTFEAAAQTAGVTLEKVPAFSRESSSAEDSPEVGAVKQRAATLKEGELSDFLPTATGGVVAHLDKRLPIDEAAFEKEKGSVAQRLERQEDESVFQDWLRVRRTAANVQATRG